MSVELDPPEQLEFNRPFTQQVARYLKVRNLHDAPVAYKVKTTAPRSNSYTVRPNSGRIEPGQEVEVQVLLQAMKSDVPLDVKCKDKFLLQSTKLTDTSLDVNLSDLWTQIEKDVMEGKMSKDLIQQKKIRCVWGPPLDASRAPESHPVADQTDDKPNGVNAGHPDNAPVQPPPIIIGQPHSTPSTLPPLVPTTPSNQKTAFPPAPAPAPSLETQLQEAKAQIAALTKQLEITNGSGLRQRNNPSSTNTTTTSTTTTSNAPPPDTTIVRPSSPRDIMQTAVEQGVPVKIVAYLCLAAFLLAYLFF